MPLRDRDHPVALADVPARGRAGLQALVARAESVRADGLTGMTESYLPGNEESSIIN
jgi:hypothetical protein